MISSLGADAASAHVASRTESGNRVVRKSTNIKVGAQTAWKNPRLTAKFPPELLAEMARNW